MQGITKDKILSTAAALFAKDGVRVVSIDDICRKLCISKKTFYQFYPQKEDLIWDVLSAGVDKKDASFKKMAEGKDTVELVVLMFDLIGKKKTIDKGKRMAAEVEKYYPETFQNFVFEKGKVVRHYFYEGFARGREEGYLRTDLDIEATALLFTFMHRGVVDYNEGRVPIDGKKIPFKAIIAAFEDMFIHSIFSEKGLQRYIDLKKEAAGKEENKTTE